MDTIGISFGRFNPPHTGHVNVWEQAASCDHFYIGTNPTTSGKNDPLPYEIKNELMIALCPKIKDHILAETNIFTMITSVYNIHGENNEIHIYTDESWLLSALIKYNGVESTHGYYKFKHIFQNQTPRLCSATSLRQSIKKGDRTEFYLLSGIPIDTEISINTKVFKFFDIVEEFIE